MLKWWVFFSSALNFRPKQCVLSFLPFSSSLPDYFEGLCIWESQEGLCSMDMISLIHIPIAVGKDKPSPVSYLCFFSYLLLKIRDWWRYIISTCVFHYGNFFLTQAISFWTDKSASFACLLTHSKVHVTVTTVSLQFFPIYFTFNVCDTLFRWLTRGIPKLIWWSPFIDKTGHLTSVEKHGHPEIPYKIFPSQTCWPW